MLWKTYQIEKNKRYLSHIGPLTLQVKVVSHDWYLAYNWEPENWDLIEFRETEPEQPEAGIDWHRWVTDSEAMQITLLPVMPDRSLVIRPEIPFPHHTLYAGSATAPFPVRLINGEEQGEE